MLIRQFIALLSFCTLELTGCNKIAAPSSMYHHQSSMNFNSLRSSVIVRNPNKKTTLPYNKPKFPSKYEFRPLSPTREEVRRMSFSDAQQSENLLLILPIPIRLSQGEALAAQALLKLSQGQSG